MNKHKKIIKHTFFPENKIFCIFTYFLLFSGQNAFAAWELKPGSRQDIPVNVTSNYPNKSKSEDHRNQNGQITPLTTIDKDERCDMGLNVGLSSDNSVRGLVIAPDILLTFSGEAKSSVTTPSYQSSWTATDGNVRFNRGNYPSGGYMSNGVAGGTLSCIGTLGYWQATNSTAGFNGKITIYVGPAAKLGTYQLPKLYWNVITATKQTIFSGGTLIVNNPRVCTVSTDNTITFPAVDITDAVNAKALANKTGNFTVTCDDTTNAPVTVEMQGLKGRYTDTMALTMTDGTNAPAEIRGFIGSDIPLGGECNGRLNGYTGIVYFIPNAGLEKMPFKPGSYKYNWVLCSTGAYKTGKATGSAKMVVSWD